MPSISDVESENMLLGAFLLAPELMAEPWAKLPREAFYSEENRIIFDIMTTQRLRFGRTETHTVMMDLRAADRHDLCPKVPGLFRAFCDDHAADSGLAEMTAARLMDMWRGREAEMTLQRGQKDMRDGVPLSTVQMEVSAMLAALNSTSGEPTLPGIETLLDEMEVARVSTGYPDIDRETGGGITNADLNVLAAPPSTGKSALARGIIRKFVQRGQRVFWLSQDQAFAQVVELEIARVRNTDTRQVRNLSRAQKRETLERLYADWQGHLVVIDKPLPLDQIVSAARSCFASFVVIDYLQIVITQHRDEYESITEASKTLKALARELGVPVLALSQFNRAYKLGETPQMSWLRGSGQIEQDAAQIWGLVRDLTLPSSTSQVAQLHIIKNKTGPTGMARLSWVAKYAGYEMFSNHADWAN